VYHLLGHLEGFSLDRRKKKRSEKEGKEQGALLQGMMNLLMNR